MNGCFDGRTRACSCFVIGRILCVALDATKYEVAIPYALGFETTLRNLLKSTGRRNDDHSFSTFSFLPPFTQLTVSSTLMAHHPFVSHVQSQATEEDLLGLRATYHILDYVLMRLPTEDKRIDTLPLGWVSFVPQMFLNGVRIRLSLFA